MRSGIFASRFDLPSTIQTPTRTRHQLYVFVVAFESFKFSDYVLYVLETICLNEFETNARISHLLVMFILTLLVD